MESIFIELSAIIVTSTALALLAKIIKQPIVLAFLATGILLGPIGFNVIRSNELINALASFGLVLLLYIVGIELNFKKFKTLSWPTLLVGFGQIVGTGLVGWLTAILLGFSMVEAWFIAIALTLSSTIIVVKLLSEKRQLESLYGRIVVSILLVQDFAAILALLLLETFGRTHGGVTVPWIDLGLLLVKTLVIGGAALVLAKYVFRNIFLFIGRSQELLFLWSIAWCILFAAIALLWDYPMAISVFFAGISLASLDYNHEIVSRIRSLRDFFIVIFFTFLGSQLALNLDLRSLISVVILSLFVLVGNPLIVFIILRLLKHHERTAFFAGLTMAQISEFSFVLANQGLKLGLITQPLVSLIAAIGLITIVFSTYLITYNEKVYRWLRPLLRLLPLPQAEADVADHVPVELNNHIVVFGYHVTVDAVLAQLKANGEQIVVVDYNPESSELIKRQGVYYIYGDMREEDILQLANLPAAKMIISIVPYHEPTMSLLQYIKHFKIKAKVIVTAPYLMDVTTYYTAGANSVLHPESITLQYLAKELQHGTLSTA